MKKDIIVVCSLLGCAVVLFLLSALTARRSGENMEHLHRIYRSNSIKEINLAICQYEVDHGHLPPPQTESGLSWRIELLPYLEAQNLYDQINRSVAWDHPDNVPFHDQMPDVFADTLNAEIDSDSCSPFIVVSGKGTAWPGNGEKVTLD